MTNDELDALEKRLRDIGKYMLSHTADEAADAIASLRRQLAAERERAEARVQELWDERRQILQDCGNDQLSLIKERDAALEQRNSQTHT